MELHRHHSKPIHAMELHRHHSKPIHAAAHTQHGGALAIRMLTFMTISEFLHCHVRFNSRHHDKSQWARS